MAIPRSNARHIALLVVLALSVTACSDDTPVTPLPEPPLRAQYTYPYQTGEVVLDTSKQYLALRFDAAVDAQRQADILEALGATKYAGGPLAVAATADAFEAAQSLAHEYKNEVRFFGPVFDQGSVLTVSNPQVIVRGAFEEGAAAALLASVDAEVVQRRAGDPAYAVLSVDVREANALFDLVTRLHATSELEHASQNFHLIMRRWP